MFFALVNVIGMLAYAFKGIGKFAVVMLPWHFTDANSEALFTDENIYAIIILGLTSLYAIKGGMVSVVITEVMQFTILTLTSITIGLIAIYKVSPDDDPARHAGRLDESVLRLETRPRLDGHSRQGRTTRSNRTATNCSAIIFGLMFFKGVLASLAGPAPNYDMQRILATRNPREACLMNGMVNVVLYFPRYLMIAGITVLALAFCMPQLRAHGQAGFRETPADCAARICADGCCRLFAGRADGGVHVQLRRHAQRRPGLHRQRHLQTIHQSHSMPQSRRCA